MSVPDSLVDDTDRCWFGRFTDTREHPWCPHRGEWGAPKHENPIIALMRWCSEHRHSTDQQVREGASR